MVNLPIFYISLFRNYYCIYCSYRYQKPAAYTGLIHRVDRPCSGVVVFAKTSKCAARLSDQFRMRSVLKYYVCMVNGKVLKESGACNHLLLKVKGEKTACLELSESKKRPDAVAGALKYQVIHRVKDSNNAANEEREQTLLAITLETGRKHQIRAQLAHIGHPIVGDIKYGAPQRFRSKEIALHSCILSFAHPITDNQVVIRKHVLAQLLYSSRSTTKLLWQASTNSDTYELFLSFLSYVTLCVL